MFPENHITELLKYIDENPDREGLKKTPERVIKSYDKLFEGYKQDPKSVLTVFDSEKYDEMIICKDIEFYNNV